MNKGIYALVCKANGKMYIGYSFNFKTRKRTHWTKMNQGNYKGKNDQLQNDWNLYGKESFKFVIIEELNTDSINEMLQKEEDYIVRFGTFFEDKGYNISLPVSKQFRNGFINKHGEEFLRELVFSNDDLLLKEDYNIKEEINKKVYQINKNNDVVRIWNNSYLIKEFYNLTDKGIEKIFYLYNRGKSKVTKTYKGYVWLYDNKYDSSFNYSTVFNIKSRIKKEKPFISKGKKNVTPINSKKVSLQNIETGEIWNFDSQNQAERILGFKIRALIKGFKTKGGGEIAKITQWRGWKIYKEDI